VVRAENICRFDQRLHGLEPDYDLHSEKGRRNVAIEFQRRDRFDLERFQLGQRIFLQRRWSFPFLLHIMGREENGPPPAESSIDQFGAVEIVLQ